MKYVVDTNVLISNPYSIYSFAEPGTEIIIPSAVMEELDHLKRKQEISREVRLAVRLLSKIILGHSYEDISEKGIALKETNPALPDSVTLKIRDYTGDDTFELDKQDARIIATCKQEGATLVTRDINMLLIAMSSGCEVIQYTGDDSLKDSDVLYSGVIKTVNFWDDIVELGYEGENNSSIRISYSSPSVEGIELYPNQYIIDIESNELIGKVVRTEETFFVVQPINGATALKRRLAKSIHARDALQAAAVDAMMNADSDVVSILGGAGSGKTMIAVGAAMEMISRGRFANLLYVKSDSPLSGEVGFLPGSLQDKLRPSIEPCLNSLNILYKDESDVDGFIEKMMEEGVVQFPSLYYFRGRSIGHPDKGKGSILLVDEAQNLSNHEMKSIISRCGENTLLILCGNIKQIDNPRNTAVNNGFVWAVEKFKDYEHASHVILENIYRSRLAAFVEENF